VAQLVFPSTIAERGLATLTARTIRGGLAMTGNTLLTCDASSVTCVAALASGDNISATMTPSNSLATTRTGTTASSSANLQLVAGATVSEAYVVWGAASMDGSPLSPNGLAVAWMSTAATGATSISTSLQTVGANDFYARADVTDLVSRQGSGTYGFGLVGGLAGVKGSNQSAGWALVVVYERAADPVRSVVVLDGLSVMGGGAGTTLQLGALGPVASARPASVGFVTFDGDRGQADVICVNDVRIADAANPTTIGPCDQPYPTDDAFNSTVSLHGVAQAIDAGGNTTSLGFDVDLIDTALPVEASSRLSVAATADVVRLALVAIVVDA
jgi:large repetitive protein